MRYASFASTLSQVKIISFAPVSYTQLAKEELMPTAKAMAAKIISKGSYAVSVAKAAINNGYDMDIKNEMCIRDRL